MPGTMPWKQALMCLAVSLVIPTSTSMSMDFCNENRTVRNVNIEYKGTSEYEHCICHVQHTDPKTSKKYTVRSRGLKGSSDFEGGYYNISFISGGEMESVVNETKVNNEILFRSSQNIATDITLELSDLLKRPTLLGIRLISGDGGGVNKLRIMCRHIEQPTTTVTSTSVTESSAPPLDNESTPVTHTSESSSVGDETSPVYETPTSTVGSQALPSTANKESDSTIPIAGGVIGGLLCIAVGIIIVFILRRRNKLNKEGPSSKTSHDNPVYGAPGPDVIYDLPNHVTEKSHDLHENDTAMTTMDSNYFTLEDNGGNEGYSYVSPSNVGHTDGPSSLGKTENQEDDDDCYNHTNVAAESRDRPKGDNYVNVAARTREDYDHVKPNTGFTPGPSSNPSDKDDNSYNHPGQIPLLNTDSEDCYNHLGDSSSQPSTEDCYNHVGQHSSQATIHLEDCYNHLGLLPSQSTMDSDDGYSRAGNISPQTMNDEDCYNHLR